jgi:hypothetical protein
LQQYFSSFVQGLSQVQFEKKSFGATLEKKGLSVPYTVYSEPKTGEMTQSLLVNGKFVLADSFLFGNVLQTPSKTYGSVFTLERRKDPPLSNRSCDICYYYGYKKFRIFHDDEKKNDTHLILKTGEIFPSSGIEERRTFFMCHERVNTTLPQDELDSEIFYRPATLYHDVGYPKYFYVHKLF